jgi:hypothetical protein
VFATAKGGPRRCVLDAPATPAKPTPSATSSLDLDRRGQLEAPPVAGRDADLGVLVGGDRRF